MNIFNQYFLLCVELIEAVNIFIGLIVDFLSCHQPAVILQQGPVVVVVVVVVEVDGQVVRPLTLRPFEPASNLGRPVAGRGKNQ